MYKLENDERLKKMNPIIQEKKQEINCHKDTIKK